MHLYRLRAFTILLPVGLLISGCQGPSAPTAPPKLPTAIFRIVNVSGTPVKLSTKATNLSAVVAPGSVSGYLASNTKYPLRVTNENNKLLAEVTVVANQKELVSLLYTGGSDVKVVHNEIRSGNESGKSLFTVKSVTPELTDVTIVDSSGTKKTVKVDAAPEDVPNGMLTAYVGATKVCSGKIAEGIDSVILYGSKEKPEGIFVVNKAIQKMQMGGAGKA